MFEQLNDVLKEYNGQEDLRSVPINVDALWPMIKRRSYSLDDIKIERVDVDADQSSLIMGRVGFYEAGKGPYAGIGKYARIQYASHLDLAWTRLVVCKELWQCALDGTRETRVTTAEEVMELAEHLVSDLRFRDEEYVPGRTEEQALILAIETLFPLELRRGFLDDYDGNGLNDKKLSARFEIPPEIVSDSFSPTYFSWAIRNRADGLVGLD